MVCTMLMQPLCFVLFLLCSLVLLAKCVAFSLSTLTLVP